MKRSITKLPLNELRELHRSAAGAIRARLAEFKMIPPTEYFYELAYCLLTPQSSALNAEQAVRVLREQDLQYSPIDPEPVLHRKDFYIRFHKTKANHLLAVKKQYDTIHPHLMNGSAGNEVRAWLVKNVRGLGWKEASHFLRNIGHENLAILDRHILRNLVKVGVLRALPKTLTQKRYLAIERRFLSFANMIRIPMDELDLLFWSIETGEILK